MPKVRLQRPRVVASVGQCVAAGVPEHVRMWLEAGSQWTRVSDNSGQFGQWREGVVKFFNSRVRLLHELRERH